jgi:hypothetical protein
VTAALSLCTGCSGLLIAAAGLAVIAPLRGADKPAAAEPAATGR